jgi:hypothetical protein
MSATVTLYLGGKAARGIGIRVDLQRSVHGLEIVLDDVPAWSIWRHREWCLISTTKNPRIVSHFTKGVSDRDSDPAR